MFNKRLILVLVALLINISTLLAETVLEGFENGLSNYKIVGDYSNIQLDSNINYRGKYSIRFGGSDLKLQRKIVAEPLAIMVFNTFAKTNIKQASNNIYISLQYYDKNDKLINEFQSYIQDTLWKKYEISMITPPLANYALLTYNFNYDSTNNYVNIDESYWSTNSLPIPEVKVYTYDKYLRPFWSTDTVFDESALLVASLNGQPKGKLLCNIEKIIKVDNSYLDNQFVEGRDYNVKERIITSDTLSEMPFYIDTMFIKDVFWYSTFSNKNKYFPQWINVTYNIDRSYNCLPLKTKTNYLVNTYKKLLNKDKTKIAIIGNSITRGMFVSGLVNFKPNIESYFTMFCKYLKKYYINPNIEYYNLSMPASIVKKFGVECFTNYIKPINPDLLIIDYGMADFWGTSPTEFKESIMQIIDSVKTINKNAEIIVVSEMRFDPAYLQDTNDVYIKSCYTNMKGYQIELKKIEQLGIANVDLYSISDSLFNLKKPKDMLTDPVHPNDYMNRWYAQGLISALVPVMSGSINKVVNRTNQLVLDNLESKVAQSRVGTNEIIISNKQDWEFHKLENGNNRILSNDSKLALAVENGELIQAIIKDTSSQEWELIPLDDQFYKLKNIATQKYLSMDTINNSLLLENENNSNAQQWNIFYSYKKEELSLNRDTTIIDYTLDTSNTLQIASNTKWNVTTKANWVHFDKNEGNGKKTLKLSIDENLDKSQRAALIEIKTNGLKRQHFVIQNGSKTSINDTNQSNVKFRIIPPSANDNNIYLICDECLANNITVEIFDMTGRVVFQRDYSQSNQIIKIDSNQFSSGQYIIKVNNGNQAITEKVVITK